MVHSIAVWKQFLRRRPTTSSTPYPTWHGNNMQLGRGWWQIYLRQCFRVSMLWAWLARVSELPQVLLKGIPSWEGWWDGRGLGSGQRAASEVFKWLGSWASVAHICILRKLRKNKSPLNKLMSRLLVTRLQITENSQQCREHWTDSLSWKLSSLWRYRCHLTQ